MTELGSLIEEARRLSVLIDKGVDALRRSAEDVARAENAYRHERARAWMQVKAELAREREAYVDGITADLRLARDLAEGSRQAALEALRSRRAQLDALRSILSATRSEMELAE